MKIGRNDKCPCGSGKKYKRCCANKPQGVDGPKPVQKEHATKKVTLSGAIEIVQNSAVEKKEILHELGVFLLYADKAGDAWVLEITDSDCIQIASGGKVLEVPLEENDDTIVVEWSHNFTFKNKQLQITSYKGKEQRILENAPSQQLSASAKRILSRFSAEMLDQVHVSK